MIDPKLLVSPSYAVGNTDPASPSYAIGRGWGLRSPKNLLIVGHMVSQQHGQPGLFLVSNLLTGLLLRRART